MLACGESFSFFKRAFRIAFELHMSQKVLFPSIHIISTIEIIQYLNKESEFEWEEQNYVYVCVFYMYFHLCVCVGFAWIRRRMSVNWFIDY